MSKWENINDNPELMVYKKMRGDIRYEVSFNTSLKTVFIAESVYVGVSEPRSYIVRTTASPIGLAIKDLNWIANKAKELFSTRGQNEKAL